MVNLNTAQFLFSECLGKLLAEVERRGWKCTTGDVWAVNFNWMIKDLNKYFDEPETDFIVESLMNRLHSSASNHYDKLAVDLNLFKPEWFEHGHGPDTAEYFYCTTTEDHAELGGVWKGLHPACEWGGDFPGDDIDGNHYQVNREKV